MHSSFVSEVRIYNGKGVGLIAASFWDTPILTEAERLVTSSVAARAREVKLNKDDKLADWLAADQGGVFAAVG